MRSLAVFTCDEIDAEVAGAGANGRGSEDVRTSSRSC